MSGFVRRGGREAHAIDDARIPVTV